MDPRIILVLEDDPKDLKEREEALAPTGFHCILISDPDKALAAAANVRGKIDVMLIDMEIIGRGDTAGGEFGVQVREQQQDWPPEFVINSALTGDRFYRLAFRLGAATYLPKATTKIDEVVRYVRVLALRRHLSPGNPELLPDIEAIARESGSASGARLRFCSDVLLPQFEACFHNISFLLLVEHHGNVRRLGASEDQLATSPGYDALMRLSHLKSVNDPLVVQGAMIAKALGATASETDEAASDDGILRGWENAAVVPLLKTDDLKLSLAIGPLYQAPRFHDDAIELAKLAGSLIQPALVKHLLTLTERWTKIFLTQRAVLEAAGDFCLYVGQAQSLAIEGLLRSGALAQGRPSPDLTRLASFVESLRRAGELLTWINLPPGLRGPEENPRVLSMQSVVAEALHELAQSLSSEQQEAITVRKEKNCFVAGKPADLVIAIRKILSWMTQRVEETPAGIPPEVVVVCDSDDNQARVTFEDRSRRLPEPMRERLFSLFSAAVPTDPAEGRESGEILGLYLSKVLIELENRGRIEDRSADLEGDVGHRFVVSFPTPTAAAVPSC